MRMKGISFHDIDTAPASQSPKTVTGSQNGRNALILPAIIQNEAVNISPVVLCPAATSVNTDVANSNKRQKTEDTTAKAVSRNQQSTSGVKVVPVSIFLLPSPKTVQCTTLHSLLHLHATWLGSAFKHCLLFFCAA